MNTSTPETDNYCSPNHRGGIYDFARKLERERDEAIEKAAAFEQAVQDERNIHMTTIAERDQLRKVCDELAKVCEDFPSAVGNCETGEHWVPVDHWEEYAQKNNAALSSYNSLPHVIAAKKGNEV